jgi:uncharacterized membrane protein
MSRRSASRRSRTRRSAACVSDFATINVAILDSVIGGRITPRTTLDPVLTQGIQQLSQAIASVGQNLAAAKQGSSQQMMQMMQQMMQSRGHK